MNPRRQRHPKVHALVLSAALCTAAGFSPPVHANLVTLEPATTDASPAPVVGPSTDSFWGRITCGFALALANNNPDLVGEAVLICFYIQSLDG